MDSVNLAFSYCDTPGISLSHKASFLHRGNRSEYQRTDLSLSGRDRKPNMDQRVSDPNHEAFWIVYEQQSLFAG